MVNQDFRLLPSHSETCTHTSFCLPAFVCRCVHSREHLCSQAQDKCGRCVTYAPTHSMILLSWNQAKRWSSILHSISCPPPPPHAYISIPPPLPTWMFVVTPRRWEMQYFQLQFPTPLIYLWALLGCVSQSIWHGGYGGGVFKEAWGVAVDQGERGKKMTCWRIFMPIRWFPFITWTKYYFSPLCLTNRSRVEKDSLSSFRLWGGTVSPGAVEARPIAFLAPCSQL